MFKRILPRRSIEFVVVVLLSQGVSMANDVSNHTQETNDRFSNDDSFIASGYDLSGIGRTEDGNWATRIGDNYFLSANHFHPDSTEEVTFFSSNDPSGPSFTYATTGGVQIAGTDIWLGYFDESIDSSINTYRYTTQGADSLAETGIANMDVLMFGNNNATGGDYGGLGNTTNVTVAQNQVESWLGEGTTGVAVGDVTNNFSIAASFDQIVTFKNESVDNAYSFQTYEGQLEGGDSGSPLLSFAGNELIIQGLAYAVVTDNGGLTGNFEVTPVVNPRRDAADTFESREASFYTYVGSYESGIESAILNIPLAVSVPEPSSSLLLALGTVGLILKRRRS